MEFDRAVTVTGSPYLSVTIGSNVRQAVYQSGTGTDTILFRYTTVPGDVDTDGISVGTTITANSGTILGNTAPAASFFSVVANNSLSIPSTLAILIEAIQPQPTSVSRSTDTTNRIFPSVITDNTWIIAQEFLISVVFNTNIYVTQTGGTPRIPITIGASTQYATYLSGGNGQTTLIFRYVVQENDLDSDGTIALGDIDLNGGTITDISNTNTLLPIPSPTLTTTYIDGVKPTILSVGAAANGTYSTLSGNNHLIMTFTVTWAEAVNYSTTVANIPLTIGATAVNAAYASGNNTTPLIHRVSSLAGYTDTDGIAVASPMTGTAVIKDQAGNTAAVLTFTPPTTTGILVDTTTPSISSVTAPAVGTYVLGNDLNFTVNYDEIVNVVSSGGYPRIALVMDSGTKYATYVSGSGTSNLLFRYTVVANDSDLTGITNPTLVSITNAPTAYIRDIGWNGDTTSSYAATIDLTGVVVDALAPTISSSTYPSNGTYDAGDVLQITLTYSEAVLVTGTPRIQVVEQTGTINLNYTGGAGTTVLTFEYTVTVDDFDFDGLPTSITAVDLTIGTINDANSNAASSTFAAINLSAVYLAYPNTVVWTTNNFVNKSAIPGIALGSTGVVTNEACGTNTCRTFDGDDDLSISAGITGAETVFIVFKTPSTLGNLDLFATDISLTDDGSTLDLNTANASINLDGVTSLGINHNVNMSVSTTHILQADFTAPENYGITSIIPTSYSGAIGELIIINALLTNAQKTEILNYLNTKY